MQMQPEEPTWTNYINYQHQPTTNYQPPKMPNYCLLHMCLEGVLIPSPFCTVAHDPQKTTADSNPQAEARFSNLLDLPSRQTSERFLELKTTSFWKGLPANFFPISICYRKCPPGPWSKNGHATCPLWKSPHLLSKQSSVCLLPHEWTQRLLLAPCFRNHKCSALPRASASEPFYDFAWPHASFSNHFKRPTAFPLNHLLRPIEAKKTHCKPFRSCSPLSWTVTLCATCVLLCSMSAHQFVERNETHLSALGAKFSLVVRLIMNIVQPCSTFNNDMASKCIQYARSPGHLSPCLTVSSLIKSNWPSSFTRASFLGHPLRTHISMYSCLMVDPSNMKKHFSTLIETYRNIP